MFFDWNTAKHAQDNEARPEKRAFTKQELQDFFDHADDQVSAIAASNRKGWLPAYRDAAMFKIAYSYGLRFNELSHLQTVDFARNPHAKEFGKFGLVHVRYGKRYCDELDLSPGLDLHSLRREPSHAQQHRPHPAAQ